MAQTEGRIFNIRISVLRYANLSHRNEMSEQGGGEINAEIFAYVVAA